MEPPAARLFGGIHRTPTPRRAHKFDPASGTLWGAVAAGGLASHCGLPPRATLRAVGMATLVEADRRKLRLVRVGVRIVPSSSADLEEARQARASARVRNVFRIVF